MHYYVVKQVQSKTRNKINFKFHFIIYRDLNAIVFSKRFHTINMKMKFNTVQNVCCRILQYIVFAMRNESTIVNSKKIQILYYVNFYISIHDQTELTATWNV